MRTSSSSNTSSRTNADTGSTTIASHNFARNQTYMERAKFQLCVAIERSMVRQQLDQRHAAFDSRTSRAFISRVCNKRLDQLSFNQLFKCLERLTGRYEILISI